MSLATIPSRTTPNLTYRVDTTAGTCTCRGFGYRGQCAHLRERTMNDNGTALAPREGAELLERVLVGGDLAKLSPAERLDYYRRVTESLGLNPLTRPFEYVTLNGKLTLYARKDATDQLRNKYGVSITKLERDRLDDLYVVTAYATARDGRSDSAIGAVSVAGLKGEALANALMKAETKAKRRVTLSLCGLGWTDETEVDSIPSAATTVVDHSTGEIVEQSAPAPSEPAPTQRMLDAYARLVHDARELGLDVPLVNGNALTKAGLTTAGMDLKARIEAAKDERRETSLPA